MSGFFLIYYGACKSVSHLQVSLDDAQRRSPGVPGKSHRRSQAVMVGAKDDIGLPFGKTSVNLRCDCPRVDIACMGNYSPQSRKLL